MLQCGCERVLGCQGEGTVVCGMQLIQKRDEGNQSSLTNTSTAHPLLLPQSLGVEYSTLIPPFPITNPETLMLPYKYIYDYVL